MSHVQLVGGEAPRPIKDNLPPAHLRLGEGAPLQEYDPDRLYQTVEAQVSEIIQWYLARKEGPKRISQILRLFAIVTLTLGGLIPIVAAQLQQYDRWSQWGYVIIALGGAALALDRFGGFSSSWMRFISTTLRLQGLLSAFQLDWAICRANMATPPTTEQAVELLEQLKAFRAAVWTEVQAETDSWIQEFKSSMVELQKQMDNQVQALRPGTLTVKVENTAGVDEKPVVLYLDDRERTQVRNGMALVKPLPAGTYAVRVEASRQGKAVEASGVVTITSGATVTLELQLPT